MSAAFKLNDLISFDRNRNLKAGNKISAGRMISKDECLSLCPVLNQRMMTGGGLFFDAQVQNPSRLNLAVLLSAVKSGAVAANYVRVNHKDSGKETMSSVYVLVTSSVDIPFSSSAARGQLCGPLGRSSP